MTSPINTLKTGMRTVLGTEVLSAKQTITGLAVSEGKLFYQKFTENVGGPLKKRSALTLGTAEEVETLGYEAEDLAATDRFLVWRRHSRSRDPYDDIFRLPIGAVAITRNLSVTGIPEVVQAIQNAANDCPLVANKVTHVRAFGRMVASSEGELVVDAGLNMVLHGARGGVALPGSPLVPIALPSPPPPLRRNEGFRANPADGYWFRLPQTWTAEGVVTLTAEVNPNRVLTETSYSDNQMSTSVTFTKKPPVGLKIIPTVTRFGAISRYSPALEELFTQLDSLIPTSDLRVEISHDRLDDSDANLSHSAFEFRPGKDDRKRVIEGLRWRKIFGSGATLAEPDGFDHYVSILPHSAAQDDLGGGASIGRDLPQGTQVMPAHLYFLDPEKSDIGVRVDATTAAQELARNYGRRFIRCQAGSGELDGDYPYRTTVLSSDAAGFLGFNALSGRYVGATEAKDYMSFCDPKWTSDYTWTALFHRISSGAREVVLSTRLGSAQRVWATGGLIDTRAMKSDLRPVVHLGTNESAVAIALGYPTNPRFQLFAYDADGLKVGTVPVGTEDFSNDEGHGPVDSLAWMCISDLDLSRVVRLELVDLQDTRTPVGRILGGNTPPLVDILEPKVGLVEGPSLRVRWASADDGGRSLAHTLRYSHDKGASWRTLTTQLGAGEFVADTAALPGGEECMIEVIASDGIRSSSVRSAAFTIANKAPETWLFYENGTGKICDSLATARVDCGERLILHARSDDLEDGTLPDSSLSWKVSGPLIQTGLGRQFQPSGLIPGSYTVELTATDSVGATGRSISKLIVRSAFVENSIGGLTVNGFVDDPAYLLDRAPKDLRYMRGEGGPQVRMIHSNGQLLVACSGIMPGGYSDHRFAIGLDLDRSGGAPQTGDLLLEVQNDGGLLVYRGRNGSWLRQADALGVLVGWSGDDDRHAVEISIPDSLLAGWNGRTIRCFLADLDRYEIGDSAVWPPGSDLQNLTLWADLVLGPDPENPIDADRDGMPDAWEMSHFGSLTTSGWIDTDGDGQTDLSEFIAGTNPRLASSAFRATVNIRGNIHTLSWPSAPERSYSVWRSDDLLEFVLLASGLPASAGGSTAWVDPAPPRTKAYYRVEVHSSR